MSDYQFMPKFKLSVLRDLGWSLWDPIGLMPEGWSWEDDDCAPFADEYDRYLLELARREMAGATVDELISYLLFVVKDQMGIRVNDIQNERAQRLVAALRCNKAQWLKAGDVDQ